MTEFPRRDMLGGLLALAAPAIIRTPGLLMPVRMARHGVDFLTVSISFEFDAEAAVQWLRQEMEQSLLRLLSDDAGKVSLAATRTAADKAIDLLWSSPHAPQVVINPIRG